MKTPVPPPKPYAELLTTTTQDSHLLAILSDPRLSLDPDYHPWEWFLRHEPPAGFTRQEWWLAVRGRRMQAARTTPFTLSDGTPLTYNLPDPLLRLIDDASSRASGQIQMPEPIANPASRDRYLISSLIEEAITSSQLEGASTSRVEAKRMLRENRRPRDRSEQMILNNYEAMQNIPALRDAPLTPELICQIHRQVTQGTLDDPDDAGRIQRPGEDRVRIYGGRITSRGEQVLHVPPPAEELPERMRILCAFANSSDSPGSGQPYMPPLLRAITLHFMMGHDHYFADGNGRTSRAVFYWSMLRQGFFLTEYLSISRLLRRAPAEYARSFLHTEYDEGDLTHFFLYQAEIISRSIDELSAYLTRKSGQVSQASRRLRDLELNHRQVSLIESFLRDPGASATVAGHQRTHGVSTQTARTDLQDLEARGLLTSAKQGRRVVWYPVADLPDRIGA
ncbi:Fic family protein [Actinomyces bowdenii]|uniref:Fic family protein n=1 Tax=Actinomyces bowdenii TaxID=131109 RepID=UPI001ABCD6C5|nr:Fic family protein [Actinomyces bowdenii]MBO3725038.1 Fic family protein [Actinomyces bowdenii]